MFAAKLPSTAEAVEPRDSEPGARAGYSCSKTGGNPAILHHTRHSHTHNPIIHKLHMTVLIGDYRALMGSNALVTTCLFANTDQSIELRLSLADSDNNLVDKTRTRANNISVRVSHFNYTF